jgi:hypothetical protein
MPVSNTPPPDRVTSAVNDFLSLLEDGCENESVLGTAIERILSEFEVRRNSVPPPPPPVSVEVAAATTPKGSKLPFTNRLPIDASEPTTALAASPHPLPAPSSSSHDEPGHRGKSESDVSPSTESAILDQPTTGSKIRSEKGLSLLEIAVERQNLAAVKSLLAHRADPDKVVGLPCTCLCRVCYAFPHNITMIRCLLDAGANPDATTNSNGASASCLIISVVKDNIEAVKLLIQYGADVSYEWKGSNAFAMAVDFKKKEIADVFEQRDFQVAKANRLRKYEDRIALEAARERVAQEKKQKLRDGTNTRVHYRHDDNAGAAPGAATSNYVPTASDGSPPATDGAIHRRGSDLANPLEREGAAPEAMHQVDILNLEEELSRSSQSKENDKMSVTPPRIVEDVFNLTGTIPPPQAAQGHVGNGAGVPASSPPSVNLEAERAKQFSDHLQSMDWIVPLDEVLIGDPISSGAHGDVFKAILKTTGDHVALKRFPCLDQRGRETFRREVAMLSRFRHENIVLFRGAIIDPTYCGLLSELCATSLFDRIHDHMQPSPTWTQVIVWARDIARAMTYLHTRSPPVVHRDLKSMNVLLDSSGTVKLCDFGMARLREHTYITTQHIAGSPAWMAPEVLRGDDFNDCSDVYSFGVVLWELVTQKIPWPDKNMAQLVGLVGFSGTRLPIPTPQQVPGCPAALLSIIESCWAAASDRPPFRTLRTLLENIIAGMEASAAQASNPTSPLD